MVELHPMTVIIAILIGGQLVGIFGMLTRSSYRKHHQSHGSGIALGIKELPDFLKEFLLGIGSRTSCITLSSLLI